MLTCYRKLWAVLDFRPKLGAVFADQQVSEKHIEIFSVFSKARF